MLACNLLSSFPSAVSGEREGGAKQRPHLNSPSFATLPFLASLPDTGQDTEPAGSCSKADCNFPPSSFVFSSPPVTSTPEEEKESLLLAHSSLH